LQKFEIVKSSTAIHSSQQNCEHHSVLSLLWPVSLTLPQNLSYDAWGAYNSGKHGNLKEFVNSGKLRGI